MDSGKTVTLNEITTMIKDLGGLSDAYSRHATLQMGKKLKKFDEKKLKSKKGKVPKPIRIPKTHAFISALEKTYAEQRDLHLLRGGKLEDFKFTRDMIHWWSNMFTKGTTVVSLKLNFTSTKISLTAATAYSTVQLINFGLCTNHTPLASVFDEYRLFKGEIVYRPFGIPNLSPAGGTNVFLGAVIDYDDSTALANYGDAFDTVKHGQIVSGNSIPKPIRWPVQFDWLPDMTWTTTVTTATPVAYWKPFVDSTHGLGSISTGYLTGYLDVQFRQLI